MKKQIMKMTVPYNCSWKIIYDDSRKINPFTVYKVNDGHQCKIESYADFASCLHCVAQHLTGHYWYMGERIFTE